jgi:hypothetical protein
MKRFGSILIGVVVTACITSLFGVSLSSNSVRLNGHDALAATPAPATPSDPLAGSGGPVCVAMPILAVGNNHGSCKGDAYEISNNPATGGAIVAYVVLILKLLNELVGMVIIFVLIIAGIQYITSVGDASRIKNAKKRITQAITALVLYMLSIAILTFLIPGGII